MHNKALTFGKYRHSFGKNRKPDRKSVGHPFQRRSQSTTTEAFPKLRNHLFKTWLS